MQRRVAGPATCRHVQVHGGGGSNAPYATGHTGLPKV